MFTIKEDEMLVRSLSTFPVIHDASCPYYKNQTLKSHAWIETADNVKRSVGDCKKRWNYIKNRYLKRQKKGAGTSASNKGEKWALADKLKFLDKDKKWQRMSNEEYEKDSDDHVLPDSTLSESASQSSNTEDNVSQNVRDGANSKHIIDNEQILEEMLSRRSDRETILKALNALNQDDPTELFFRSIASSVKMLRTDLITAAKFKSLQMVIDLEKENSSTSVNCSSENSAASSSHQSDTSS